MDLKSSFMKMVRKDKYCWEWTAYRNIKGYGIFRGRIASRASYMIFKGAIPDGLQIDHLCRNRGCVHPKHLEAVTPKENTRRGLVSVRAGIRNKEKTHCKNGHRFSFTNTYLYKNSRQCKKCRRINFVKFKNEKEGKNYDIKTVYRIPQKTV